MEKIIEVVKAHPVPIAVGVVILLLLMNRGSSAANSGSGAAAYLQSQQIATNANTQIAALNSQTSVALGQQSVDKYSIAENAATNRAGIAANLFAMVTNTNASLSANANDDSVKTIMASMMHQENMQTIANNFTNAQSTIAANVKMNGDKLDAAKSMLESDNNAKLAQIGAQTNGALQFLGSQQDFQLKTLPMALAHEEEMARITGQNVIGLATVNGQTAQNVATINTGPAQTAAQAAKNKSDWGIVTDIGNLISSFF